MWTFNGNSSTPLTVATSHKAQTHEITKSRTKKNDELLKFIVTVKHIFCTYCSCDLPWRLFVCVDTRWHVLSYDHHYVPLLAIFNGAHSDSNEKWWWGKNKRRRSRELSKPQTNGAIMKLLLFLLWLLALLWPIVPNREQTTTSIIVIKMIILHKYIQ